MANDGVEKKSYVVIFVKLKKICILKSPAITTSHFDLFKKS